MHGLDFICSLTLIYGFMEKEFTFNFMEEKTNYNEEMVGLNSKVVENSMTNKEFVPQKR